MLYDEGRGTRPMVVDRYAAVGIAEAFGGLGRIAAGRIVGQGIVGRFMRWVGVMRSQTTHNARLHGRSPR